MLLDSFARFLFLRQECLLQLPQLLGMNPTPPQLSIAQRHQSANSCEVGIAMLRICLCLFENTDASVMAMYEVYEILFDCVQSRRQALVFNAVQVETREGSAYRAWVPP